jgi:hypothetical protein
MSELNGDKSRFHINRRRKLLRRKRIEEMLAARGTRKAASTMQPRPVKR